MKGLNLFAAEGEKFKFPEDNPFVDEDDEENEDKPSPVASVGYRYRKWDLGNEVKLIARCEHDAVLQVRSPSAFRHEWPLDFVTNVGGEGVCSLVGAIISQSLLGLSLDHR